MEPEKQTIELRELGLKIPVSRKPPRWTFGRWRAVRLKVRVTTEGDLEVIAPMSLSLTQIESFVRAQTKWIETAVAKTRSVTDRGPYVHELRDGVAVCVLGRQRTIRIGFEFNRMDPSSSTASGGRRTQWRGQLTADDLKITFLNLGLDEVTQPVLAQAVTEFVKQYSEAVIRKQVDRIEVEMGLKAKKIRFGMQRTRWGSCSSSGTISFNWRLAIAPLEVIRYVIVHEYAHLLEPNHSSRFWAIVERYCPDFRTHDRWLHVRRNQAVYLQNSARKKT